MLKSTHRAAAPDTTDLPPGWTAHRAPTGHQYFYHAETKQSTYTRPVAQPEQEELLIDYGAIQPDREVQAGLNVMQEFHKSNDLSQPRPGHFTGGRSYQDRDRRPNKQGDRAKTKTAISNCAPWVLVKTKYGRRFVHNTETKVSLWKFPTEVMMAVIDMDRVEWEKKKATEKEDEVKAAAEKELEQSAAQVNSYPKQSQPVPEDYDSDEYEEVEVTDDEVDDQDTSVKRPRLDDNQDQIPADQPPPGPQELTEDDIAWQLAQIEADEEDPGYDFDFDDQDADDDGGMPLTKDDKDALFRSLLDEHRISPFSTFDALIDTNTPTANAVITDDRWTALPNMSARRVAFDAWSRDRVTQRNAEESETGNGTNGGVKKAKKLDPRTAYLRFLSKEATPKLYWPEFKRKFRKAPEMVDKYFPDKDREKLYREYITKLKMNESERKKEFTALLKSLPGEEWAADEGDALEKVEKDIRFYGVRDERDRLEIVDAFRPSSRR